MLCRSLEGQGQVRKVYMGSRDMRIHNRVKAASRSPTPSISLYLVHSSSYGSPSIPCCMIPVSSAKKNCSRMGIRNKGGRKKATPEATVVNSWVCSSPSALVPTISHKQKLNGVLRETRRKFVNVCGGGSFKLRPFFSFDSFHMITGK